MRWLLLRMKADAWTNAVWTQAADRTPLSAMSADPVFMARLAKLIRELQEDILNR
jgi:hypothetical protein